LRASRSLRSGDPRWGLSLCRLWGRRASAAQAKPSRPRKGGKEGKEPMNSITLVGRLTRDPEKRATPGGTDVSMMRLAIAKSGNGGGLDFVNVTAFGKLAQSCNEYLAKGRQVAVQGRLSHSEWKTDSGERRERHQVVA